MAFGLSSQSSGVRLPLALFLAVFAVPAAAQSPGADRDPLARARLLYNQRQFEAAVGAAEQARLVPARADSADLIAARAYLERFRETSAGDDLANARDRLRRLDPVRFGVRERGEFLVGLGQALYFDQAFGAAANVFGSVLLRAGDLPADARERVLDWWASAVDRDIRPRPEIERQMAYQRVRDRMQEELGAHPASAAACYWLSAAAQRQGDAQAAWDAAEAGWVRAPLALDRGAALRADLDRLVLLAIVPGRARVIGQPAETVRAEWERFKERWE